MNDDALFQVVDYKEFIKEKLKTETSPWGRIRDLAQAAGCQRSYLSQVLHSHPHLTKDQAYGIARFWRLGPAETEYFLLLVESARSGSRGYREHIDERLRELRKQRANLSRRVSPSQTVSEEIASIYYSAWYWAAIHLATSIPAFQTEKALAERFQLPLKLVETCLERLSRWGMVQASRGRWVFSGGNVHLPAASPFTTVLHQNWRSRALNDVPLAREDSIHYSSLHALSKLAYQEIQTLIQKLVEETHAVAAPSLSEELVCLNIDAFRV